jgi:hypothetical protein
MVHQLYLANTEWVYDDCRRFAAQVKEGCHGTEHWNEGEHRKYTLAGQIKDYVEEHVSYATGMLAEREQHDFTRLMIGDLIDAALSEVSWDDIADHFLED